MNEIRCILIRLRPGVARERFETWHAVEHAPFAEREPAIETVVMIRLDGGSSEPFAAWDYLEVIRVGDNVAYAELEASARMRSLLATFGELVADTAGVLGSELAQSESTAGWHR